MEKTKIFSICILALLLTRLIHSNFTLDLYLLFKILLTVALYFYPYKTETSPVPPAPDLPNLKKTPKSSPNQSKKFSFSHLTDLPIRKLDFDQVENSPILLPDTINMTENPSSSCKTYNITLSKPQKKEKKRFIPSSAPKLPTLDELLEKSKKERQKLGKHYQDCAQKLIFEYQQMIENPEPVIEAEKKPVVVHVKESSKMLPVILERNESETGFEFCPLEHKSVESSEKVENNGKGFVIEQKDKESAFEPRPNVNKAFVMSELGAQSWNLNDEKVNRNLDAPPHTVLPVYRVKPYATQMPMLGNQSEFNPIPNEKNQVVQTSSMLGSDKQRGNEFRVGDKGNEGNMENNFGVRMQGANVSGNSNHGLSGDSNKNHAFFVGGLSKADQISKLSTGTHLNKTEALVSNPFANATSLSGQVPQYSNHFANATNQSVNFNPYANATGLGAQVHNSTNNPFANATGLSTQAHNSVSNPFANANSFSATSNPFSNANNFTVKANIPNSQVNPLSNSGSSNTQFNHVANPFSNASFSNPQNPSSLNPFANTTQANNSINPFKTDANSFNPRPIANLPEHRPAVNQNNPFSVPVSNFSVSSPMTNTFTPNANFIVQSSMPQSNIYSTPPTTISNHFSAVPNSSQIPSSLTMSSNLHSSFSNPSSNSFNNFSANSGFNTNHKIEILTLSSYKAVRGQISTCDHSQKLIIEELLYYLKIHYIDMSSHELDHLHDRIQSLFKQVTEDKQLLISVSFTVYLTEFYLDNCNYDSKITTTYADYFIRLYDKLSLSIPGFSSLLEFEIKSLHEIFSPKLFSEEEATSSWQLSDLKRTCEGGILQNQITKEIKSIEDLSTLLTMFYLKHNPDTIFNLLSQLSTHPVPRQWLPLMVGILIVFPMIKTSQIAGKILSIIDVHKSKLQNIPKVCNIIYYSFEISRFNENYSKIFGF